MVRFVLIALCFIGFSAPAQADIYRWSDPDSGLSLSFPDTWAPVSSRDSATVLTVMAPSSDAFPKCEVKVQDDRRYVIFPVRYGSAVQKDTLSSPFWEAYLGEYDQFTLHEVVDGAGLGRGHASYALAGYVNYDGTVLERRRAIMFASLYYDTLYVVECSALDHAYADWHFPFLSVIKSVDFVKTYNETPSGNYRDFLNPSGALFWSQTNSPDSVVRY